MTISTARKIRDNIKKTIKYNNVIQFSSAKRIKQVYGRPKKYNRNPLLMNIVLKKNNKITVF